MSSTDEISLCMVASVELDKFIPVVAGRHCDASQPVIATSVSRVEKELGLLGETFLS